MRIETAKRIRIKAGVETSLKIGKHVYFMGERVEITRPGVSKKGFDRGIINHFDKAEIEVGIFSELTKRNQYYANLSSKEISKID